MDFEDIMAFLLVFCLLLLPFIVGFWLLDWVSAMRVAVLSGLVAWSSLIVGHIALFIYKRIKEWLWQNP